MPANVGMKHGWIRSILNLIGEKLCAPFKYDLTYFMLLWVVIALPNCYLQVKGGNVIYALYLLMMYYIIAFLVDILLNLWGKITRVLKPMVLVLLTISSLLNLYCVHVYRCLLSNDFVQIIAGTNPNEAKEYVKTFLSWEDIALFLGVIVVMAMVGWWLARQKKRSIGWVGVIPAVVLCLSGIGMWHNSSMLDAEFSEKNHWNFSFAEVVDLRNHPTHPKVEVCDSIHPECVGVILGESFSRNHSSLYGYEKKTNPLLEKKVKEGSLVVFVDVTSPCTHTTAAFKYILNTNQVGLEGSTPWYEHTNLIEVMNVAGYHTAWLSNQAEKGMFDNLPSGHARLCDESFFLESEQGADKYDGGLLRRRISAKGKVGVIYHLMGQHEFFGERYPKAYEHFMAKDYLGFPEHQRAVRAAYDNATLYNDFVVNSILDEYGKKDAIVFYFSDHALDVFDTDPNYCAHANATPESQLQGKKIPFMIYFSPIFQQRHLETVERVRSSVNHPFCTDKLIYSVMDVMGYKFASNDDVKKYSLFQESN